jgi:arginyl-tRNA synthetase
MTIAEIQDLLLERIRSTAAERFTIQLEQIAAEIPPKAELGDVAFPVAFELAKRVKQSTGEKRNPREIAEILKSELETVSAVSNVEVAGAGYLNIFLNRARFLSENAEAFPLPKTCDKPPQQSKVCVEHTSVNPNKAAHIGHVRNAVLGDTFQRILSATGKNVEVQYYIDNTGVQVADVVVGFIYLEDRDLASIKKLDEELRAEGKRFDFYCWDLYAKVGKQYLADEALMEKRASVLHLIEAGHNETAAVADYIATRNVECLVMTMERLSIRYDLLPRESEILHLHFWDRAFDEMKQLGVVRYETEGKHSGCWVMPFESHEGTDEHEADKILVRSNGTVTYTGKDIAYQMWKLGMLGLDFFYKPFYQYPDGKTVWTTTADPLEDVRHDHEFGHGETIYNVIDSRQSYTQQIVKKGVAAISSERGEKASVHLSYEMVALSPAAAEELGFQLSDDDRSKTFIEMSGRKGLGVKAEDLIHRLEKNAYDEVQTRHAESPDEEKRIIARQIAVGALRYFLLKFTRNTMIVFDFKEALSFDGETGSFCQYSAVRANSIFRKLKEQGEPVSTYLKMIGDGAAVAQVLSGEIGTDIWSMALMASRLEETIEQAAASGEPAALAKFTFNLAKSFNLFYRNHKIISEPDKLRKAVLVAVANMSRNALTAALATMGIEVPEKM